MLGVISQSSAEQFFWRESTSFIQRVVPEIDGVIDGKRPELLVTFCRPVDQSMPHESVRTFHDCLDSSLGDAVLVMGTDIGELLPLTLLVEFAEPLSRIVDAIVGVVGLYSDSMFEAIALEGKLGAEGFV